jgi:hypothetical protein
MIATQLDLDDDYLTAHRDELLAALRDAHPVAALRALALALHLAERGEAIAEWLHLALRAAPTQGCQFSN